MGPLRRSGASVAALLLIACGALPPQSQQREAAPQRSGGVQVPAGSLTVVVYVIRARWHTAVGIDVAALDPPLTALRAALPTDRYLLFGFGDRHYLLRKGPEASELLGALWPGPGVVMLTGLSVSPEAAYGPSNVIRLALPATQARDLQGFIWSSFSKSNRITPLQPGPYADSLYYASVLRYSALYTCNTWTADALRAAALPVHSAGVELAGQIWRQVERLARHDPPT